MHCRLIQQSPCPKKRIPKTCKAVVRDGPKGLGAVQVKEVPVKMPQEGAILIKSLACGVCHSVRRNHMYNLSAHTLLTKLTSGPYIAVDGVKLDFIKLVVYESLCELRRLGLLRRLERRLMLPLNKGSTAWSRNICSG